MSFCFYYPSFGVIGGHLLSQKYVEGKRYCTSVNKCRAWDAVLWKSLWQSPVLCDHVPQMVEEGSTLLRRMEICVAEAEKRSGKNAVGMQETFTVYLIETR